jgi:hypothetical protein
MAFIINCPQCRRKLQVPDTLIEKPVQCPACRLIFLPDSRMTGLATSSTAPAPIPEQHATSAPAYAEEVDGDDEHDEYETTKSAARRSVLGPSIGLMITGCFGIGVNLLQVFMWFVAPDELQRQNAEAMNLFGLPADPTPPGLGKFSGMVFAAVSLVILMAGVRMIRLNSYGLAVAGSVLAIINCSNGCCCLGLPIAVWSLVVLANPDVRDAFQ